MSSFFTYSARRDFECLSLNNSWTDFLIEELSTAASALAQGDHEREIASWFASHDVTIRGAGMCGFDLGHLPWSRVSLEADRSFILRTMAAARKRLGESQGMTDILDRLKTMVQEFAIEHACPPGKCDWPKPDTFELCPMHKLYKHAGGCLRCNAADANNNSRKIEESLKQPRRIKTSRHTNR